MTDLIVWFCIIIILVGVNYLALKFAPYWILFASVPVSLVAAIVFSLFILSWLG